MKSGTRILGAYQMIGGVWSVCSLWPAMWSRDLGSLVLLVLLSALAMVAGVVLWWRPERGWSLTMLNQLLQVIGVQLPAFTYAVVHLTSLSITGRYFARETFADSEFGWSLTLSIGDSACNVGAGMGGSQTCSVTLNLLAAGLLVYALAAKRKLGRGRLDSK